MRPMIDDLNKVADIPANTLQQLSQTLAEQTGRLSDENLVQLVARHIQDDSQGSAAFSALKNMPLESLDQILDAVDTWRNASEDHASHLSDDQYLAMREKLPILIRAYPALNRARKFDRLRIILGNELKWMAFICDARPVYNDARDDIEEMIPLTTMKIVYEKQNQLPEEIELLVTAEQLVDLISKAQKAQQKLTVLHNKLIEWLPNSQGSETE